VNIGQRWQPGDFVRIRGERWSVLHHTPHDSVSTLDVRGADAGNAGREARFLLPFEPIEPVIAAKTPRVVRPARWRVQARAVVAAATPRIDSLRTAVRSRFVVMPFQLEPALALLTGAGCRVLIADEVGLGKTVQAGLILAEVLERQPEGRALVLCPAALRTQWQRELASRFALTSTLLDAAGVAQTASHLDVTANPWAACRLIVASIDFIKRPEVMRAVEGLIWDVIVLDEAHHLAGRSDRGTAAAALAWRSRIVVMLSATPHSGNEAAFARLCALGDASNRFPLLFYRRTRDHAGMPVKRRIAWLKVRPTRGESLLLDALLEYARRVWRTQSAADGSRLAMSVLIRRAISSATSLARSIERRLASLERASPALTQLGLQLEADDDAEPILSVTGAGLADVDDERRQLEHLLALAHVAAVRESKPSALVRWLARVREPVLVFTEYRDTLVQLRRALTIAGLLDDSIAELHGGLTRTERQAAEVSFTGGRVRVLLATDAASEGLNLHHRCRCVINLEVPWNPVRLQQRIGRVDRIGQQRCVHAINLVAAGTPETSTVRRVIEREQRAMGTLRGHQPPEITTADAILNGIDVAAAGTPVQAVSMRRPDLTARAASESAWIGTARQLHTPRAEPALRPVVAVRRRSPGRLLWTTECLIRDRDGFPLWATLVTLEASLRSCGQSRPEIMHALREVDGHWRTLLSVIGDEAVRSANIALTDVLRVSAEREDAMCAAIRVRHARIAADLVQPGLFDRRMERRASSQSAVLEEALGQCQDRLNGLARLRDLTFDASGFRFALFS
jgi:superfamily II DNA or RNA helicase